MDGTDDDNNSPISEARSYALVYGDCTRRSAGDSGHHQRINFGASQSNSIVTFNGSSASAIYFWSDTNIQAKVPNGATTGNVAVTV